jgi:hypothetical protein
MGIIIFILVCYMIRLDESLLERKLISVDVEMSGKIRRVWPTSLYKLGQSSYFVAIRKCCQFLDISEQAKSSHTSLGVCCATQRRQVKPILSLHD